MNLTVGPDGNIWFTENATSKIGKMNTAGTMLAECPTKTQPSNLSAIVTASFVDGTPVATASNVTATVYWGDRTNSAGTVTGSTGGPFDVSGTHTYSKAGSYKPYVTLYDSVDKSTYTSSDERPR
jgi:hypothetical protein